MRKRLSRAMIAVLLSSIPAQSVSAAGWVDDWLTQKTGSSPSYLQGQERGYYSGGNFSARWKSSNSYPVTIEAPRVKGGCGGIDVFMGGFSFMDTSHLVNKLQAILSGAASVAFDLALKTMCEQCANTIKNMEAIADKLNSMQLDECSASKELVGIMADDNGFRSSEEMRSQLGKAIKENKLPSGASTLWSDLTKQDWANKGVASTSDINDTISGCNADIKAVFLSTSGGSMLANMGTKMGLPAEYINLMRGMVGDVRLEGATNSYAVSYQPPCPENNGDDLGAIAEGKAYSQSPSGTCAQITDTNRDLQTYVANTINGIATKIETKAALTSAETAFLDTNPLSILPILKNAVATNTKDTVIPNLADLTARAYVLQLLSDLYQRVGAVAEKSRELLARSSGPTTGQGPEKCADIAFAPKIAENISTMLKNVQHLKENAKSSYVASAQEMTVILSYMNHMKQIEDQMTAELTRRFGRDITNRIK